MSGNTGPVKEGQRTETGQTLQLESVGQPIEVLCTEPETPMLDQEPPTNDFFILQDFWPFFKILEIFGLFPCRKEINEEGGIQLKPISWWIPIIKTLGLSTLLFLPSPILQGRLESSNKEVSDYFIALGSKIFMKNTTRAYVNGFFIPLLYFLEVSRLLFVFLDKKKRTLCTPRILFCHAYK